MTPHGILVRRAWPAWAALGIGLALTLAMSLYTWSRVEAEHDDALAEAAGRLAARIAGRLTANAQVLSSTAAFCAASPGITPDDWKRYVELSGLDRALKGIQGVGLTLLVPSTARDAHEAAMQTAGLPDYRIRPSGERPD